MAAVTDRPLKAAEARGQKMLGAAPRALAARYDKATNRVTISSTAAPTLFPRNSFGICRA
jgi:hypothetical protein